MCDNENTNTLSMEQTLPTPKEVTTGMGASKQAKRTKSHARSVAFVGLAVAITAVCSWIMVPLGPVPFTLQMLAIPFIICTLTPGQSTAAIICYLLLGAAGLPVFSGMRGGFGVLMGPTGGFLLGYLIGVPMAAFLLAAVRKTRFAQKSKTVEIALNIFAGCVFTLVAYTTGCVQYAFLMGVNLQISLAVCVIPFIVPDIVKIVLAGVLAQQVRCALVIK